MTVDECPPFPGYKQGYGSVQFPLDKPIPFDLIAEIVANRRQGILPE